MRLSKHGLNRIVERDGSTNYIAEARRKAKIAYQKGRTIGYYNGKDPEFGAYLKTLMRTNTTRIRVYEDLIYIFKGEQKTFVTAHKFPRFMLKRGEPSA